MFGGRYALVRHPADGLVGGAYIKSFVVVVHKHAQFISARAVVTGCLVTTALQREGAASNIDNPHAVSSIDFNNSTSLLPVACRLSPVHTSCHL